MGGCQSYGPFLGTLNIRCRNTIGIQQGTIISTTTHMHIHGSGLPKMSSAFDSLFQIVANLSYAKTNKEGAWSSVRLPQEWGFTEIQVPTMRISGIRLDAKQRGAQCSEMPL